MKSIKFLLVSLAIFACGQSFACWSPTYTPGEYYVFYAYEGEREELPSATETNISEWRQLIGNQATYDDIWNVVYEYSLADLEKILSKDKNPSDTIYKNTFVKYLRQTNNREIVDYLRLAKECELARAKRGDKWYYPTENDLKNFDLQDILNKALAYKGLRLKNRYLLQAMRAAFSMNDYDLCLQLWEKQISRQPQSAIKSMCMDYVGGIYFRTGDYDKAIEHYSSLNASFWWCVNHLAKENSYIERMKILYKYNPNSPELAVIVQNICREAENKANEKVFDGKISEYDDYGYKSYLNNRKRYIALRDFALKVASEKRSNNPAMWQYAAAFLTFLDGKTALAQKYIAKAETLKGTPFIKNNIRILKLMTGIYAAKSCDFAFEARILPELQWLDSLMVKNVAAKIKSDYAGYKEWQKYDDFIDGLDYSTFGNYSQFYPHDMMRKITLSVLIPKYLKQKDFTKTLLYAGMASERLRSLTDWRKSHAKIGYKWNRDYMTDIFEYINALPVENVIEYQQVLQSGGNSEFEKFLVSKCYENNDCLNELIGTKYLREEKFGKAIAYLSEVSDKYIKTMNIYEYFQFNPFREIYENRSIEKPYPAYKLNYAKKMLALQEKIQTAQGNEKARAMLQYSVALQRSVSEGESWALTDYGWGWNYDNLSYYGTIRNNKWRDLLLKHSENYLAKVEKMTKNPEIKAQCYLAKLCHAEKTDYTPLCADYRATESVKQFAAECDNFYFYYVANYIPKYLEQKWGYNPAPSI